MTEKEIKEQVSYYMNKYKLSEDEANEFLDAKDQAKYSGFILGQIQTRQEYQDEIKRINGDHNKYIKELRTKIDRLSKDDTRLNELLSQYVEGTEVLHHKVALKELNTANRDFSAGYVRALEDLMKHFEGVDYEIE